MCSNKTYYKRIFSVSFVYKLSNLNEKCFKPILRSLEIVSHFDIIVNFLYHRFVHSIFVHNTWLTTAFMYMFGVFGLSVWSFSSHSKIFTHSETSPLSVKGCTFSTMFDTYGHWAVRFFFSVSHLLWHRACIYNGHLRGPVTLSLNAERLVVELSLPVLTT